MSSLTLDHLIPVTLFNRGQASRIFDRLKSERQLVVLKNNQPEAVILSPEEYKRLSEIEMDYFLLSEAQNRLANNDGKSGIARSEVMSRYGITEDDLAEVGDVEIE